MQCLRHVSTPANEYRRGRIVEAATPPPWVTAADEHDGRYHTRDDAGAEQQR
ncbi:hypothetical protein ACNKHK_14480 [Shigella flexneri]